MADANRALRADRARALGRARAARASSPAATLLVTVHREANVAARPAARGSSRGCDRLDEPLVFPAHPRTRAALDAARRSSCRPIEPLGYLDFAALASQARVILTDSGGVQKEAYWYGVPCVTLRPSTEWVDTVEAGANVLVDDDPDAIVARGRRARASPTTRRRSTATGTPSERVAAALYAVRAREPDAWDVAIIGAGYVGLPLAQTFADAGRRVLLVDAVARARRRRSTAARATSRTSPPTTLAPARRRRAGSPRRSTTSSCSRRTRS